MLRRKQTTLTLAQKCEILELIKSGEKLCDISLKYGIGKATVSDIKKNGRKILEYTAFSDTGTGNRKTLRESANPRMEKTLYNWLLQERAKGATLSGQMICDHAKVIYKQLAPSGDFKASPGWLQKFKERFRIRQLTIAEATIKVFKQDLQQKIRERCLVADQIYNAEESRFSPNGSSVGQNYDYTPEQRDISDCIPFMSCTNATGSHKLNLLISEESLITVSPEADTLWCKDITKNWITDDIRSHWFHTTFVPEVKKRMQELNLPMRALLLIENFSECPCDIVSEDGEIEVIYFPANYTPFIEPLDNLVIQSFQLIYNEKLRHINLDTKCSVSSESTDLQNAIDSLNESWQYVSDKLIKDRWKSVLWKLGLGADFSVYENKRPEVTPVAIQEKRNEIADSTTKIDERYHPDVGWTPGDNDVDERLLTHEVGIKEEILNSTSENGSNSARTISHSVAVFCFNSCITWAIENNIPSDQLALLQCLRDKAMRSDC